MIAPHHPRQQGTGQPDCGRRQLRWSIRCRALAGSTMIAASIVAIVVFSWACLGCGEVHFVPSPFTPQNVERIYSAQEDLSIVRWKISSTEPVGADLEFQILGDDGYEPIDFSRSVFPGGASLCADG